MAAILEGWMAFGKIRLLADNTAATNRFEYAGNTVNLPVSFAQLNTDVAKIFNANAIAPLQKESVSKTNQS